MVISALAGMLTACTDDSAASSTRPAAQELRLAAQRTLDAPSFRVRLDGRFGKQHYVGHGEYRAPDRSRLRSGDTDRIVIGDTMYERIGADGSGATDPDDYLRVVIPATAPKPGPGSDLTALLRTASRQGPVVRRDGRFWITTPGRGRVSPSRLSFEVAKGRVTDATIAYRLGKQRQEQRYHYFDFGQPISIEAPPADQTRGQVTPPKCPESGPLPVDPKTGFQFCVDLGE
jgi:hypothetical protein